MPRFLLLVFMLSLSSSPFLLAQESPFVRVEGGQFWLGDQPHYFVGTNFWQGMNLGMAENREQLAIELDQMQALGIRNVRIMAASEGPDTEPYRMTPALMTAPNQYNEAVLDGLDYLLAELAAHQIHAVMVLNNYWQWSGGMAQYVAWQDGSSIPYPGDWNTFMDYAAQFYTCTECQTWYRQHIEMLIGRTNPYTGITYRDDPTIFAWELANEPRRYPLEWIHETATFIKSLDPNHLVTTGSEGSPPFEGQDFMASHSSPAIDYTTIHIWIQNWGWYEPSKPDSYFLAENFALNYFRTHAQMSAELGKPMVLEEFGIARDWVGLEDYYNPDSPTTYRDRYYQALFDEVFASAEAGGAAAGDNFWAWSGAARPDDPWVGDPPHEIGGWYSVYDVDESTLSIISAHAEAMNALSE